MKGKILDDLIGVVKTFQKRRRRKSFKNSPRGCETPQNLPEKQNKKAEKAEKERINFNPPRGRTPGAAGNTDDTALHWEDCENREHCVTLQDV